MSRRTLCLKCGEFVWLLKDTCPKCAVEVFAGKMAVIIVVGWGGPIPVIAGYADGSVGFGAPTQLSASRMSNGSQLVYQNGIEPSRRMRSAAIFTGNCCIPRS
jgi:hypothetical protein